MIARAKASSTPGFIAVSLAAARSFADAPARPLLKCKEIAPVTATGEERVHQGALPVLLEERCGQPGRAVAVQELSRLATIARPDEVAFGTTAGVSAAVRPQREGFEIHLPGISCRERHEGDVQEGGRTPASRKAWPTMTPPEGRPLRRRRRATASSREQSRWGPNGKRSGLLLIEAGDLKETHPGGREDPDRPLRQHRGAADQGAAPVRRMR
jgi:hypothetical protein